ncbi:hypothetical protein [Solibacillus sp. FSL W7-1436]
MIYVHLFYVDTFKEAQQQMAGRDENEKLAENKKLETRKCHSYKI